MWEGKAFVEVLLAPALFWKKYVSCGGRSGGGVGVLSRRLPFGLPLGLPVLDGVSGALGA